MPGVLSTELYNGAFNLGLDLTKPEQNISAAVHTLNLNLVDIGCEPTTDVIATHESPRTSRLNIPSTPFSRAVRAATSAIVWREPSLVDTLPPIGSQPVEGNARAAWIPAEELDFAEIMKYSNEGAVWIDPEAARQRADIAAINASLLRAVHNGLVAGNYDPAKAKRDMRREINEQLDALWQRGSYHCFAESRILGKIMRQAGLHTPRDLAKVIKRFQSFGKDYGYGLALRRLIPEEYLIE